MLALHNALLLRKERTIINMQGGMDKNSVRKTVGRGCSMRIDLKLWIESS